MLPILNKNISPIENPIEFFSALGWLHDACLDFFAFNFVSRELIIEIDDLYSNFYQTLDYINGVSARFIFSDLDNSCIDIIAPGINANRILKFSIFEISKKERFGILINLEEGSIRFEFSSITGMVC